MELKYRTRVPHHGIVDTQWKEYLPNKVSQAAKAVYDSVLCFA